MQRYGNNFEIILKYMQLVASLNHNHNNKFIYKKPKYILLPKSKINYKLTLLQIIALRFLINNQLHFTKKRNRFVPHNQKNSLERANNLCIRKVHPPKNVNLFYNLSTVKKMLSVNFILFIETD